MFSLQHTFNIKDKYIVNVFAGQVKIVSHSPCRTSAILKYFVSCLASWPVKEQVLQIILVPFTGYSGQTVMAEGSRCYDGGF